MATNTYTKNQYGFKHCSQTFRTIVGVRYEQWQDIGISTKEERYKIMRDLENEFPGYKFSCRKISDGYRIYKSVEKQNK